MMGFRCPVCHKDFDKDNEAMIKHSENCCEGIAKDIIKATLKMCEEHENKEQEDE